MIHHDHKKSRNLKKSTKSQNFQHLEKFSSVKILYFFQTSWHFFTQFHFELEKTQNMKVVALETRFPKCPRTLKSMESSHTFDFETQSSKIHNLQVQTFKIIGHFAFSSSRSHATLQRKLELIKYQMESNYVGLDQVEN